MSGSVQDGRRLRPLAEVVRTECERADAADEDWLLDHVDRRPVKLRGRAAKYAAARARRAAADALNLP